MRCEAKNSAPKIYRLGVEREIPVRHFDVVGGKDLLDRFGERRVVGREVSSEGKFHFLNNIFCIIDVIY